MSTDIGFTHIALSASDLDASIAFYQRYASMQVVHRRIDEESGARVVWLSDRTRPFVLVLIQSQAPTPILGPFAHLGIGCATRSEVDRLCAMASAEGRLAKEAQDSGYPIGYWAFLRDPDGHTLEVSHGQEVGLTVDSPHHNNER